MCAAAYPPGPTFLTLDPVSIDAIADRLAQRMQLPSGAGQQDTYSCREFGVIIGRSAKWVQQQCAAGRLKTLGRQRPYRILGSERRRLLAA